MENLIKYRRDGTLAVTAVIIGLLSYQALHALPYYPQQWPWLVLSIIAVLTLINPRVGVAAALLFHAPAIGRISMELGIGYLAASLILVASAGDRTLSIFFLLSAVVAGSWFQPFTYLLFVVPPLAGLILGTTGGMVLGASAALFAQLLGMITGRATFGVMITGGAEPLFQSLPPVTSILELSWLQTGLSNLNLLSVATTLLRPYVLDPQLVAEVGLWTVSGYFAGRVTRQDRRWSRQSALAITVGAGILMLGHLLIPWGLGGSYVSPVQVLITGLVSGLAGFLVHPALEYADQLSAGLDLR